MSNSKQSRLPQSELPLARTPPSSLPPRNPVTHEKHRREVFRQITIPLILGVLLICAVSVLVAVLGLSGGGDVSRWADISLIWLILPALFVALVFLIVLAGLAFAVTWLLGKLPPYARLAQDFMVRLHNTVRKGADKAVEPILRAKSTAAAWRALRNR